ncbi:hypothetical protein AKG11_31275 [Shinella sp. SUS2]|nr:hypothetical protein AKG11_31275 [Shinella sp. SUS2]
MTPADYEGWIEVALDGEDPELAGSLVALAQGRELSLPSPLLQRVSAAQELDVARSARQVWQGLRHGDAKSPEAFAGALASDLTGVTDVRDLIREGKAYLADQPHDGLTLVLAIAGLTATGVTLATWGGASPARMGVTTLKLAHKAGDIPPALRASISKLTKESLDRPALDRSLKLLRQGDLTAGRQALAGALRPAPLRTLQGMATDLGDVARTQGYRASRDVLRNAHSPQDLSRLRAISSRLGKGFRAAIALLGPGLVTLAGLMVTLIAWLTTGALWILAVLFVAVRMLRWLLRHRRVHVS